MVGPMAGTDIATAHVGSSCSVAELAGCTDFRNLQLRGLGVPYSRLGEALVSYSPQQHGNRRVSRFRLTDRTPVLLQFQNGQRAAGELHVISRNGGLLLLPEPVVQGAMVQLMFQTHRGAVLGTAEMLRPINAVQQPFRFLVLPEDHQHTLQVAFQSGVYRNIDEQELIEELRASVAKWTPPPKKRRLFVRVLLGLVALAASVVCAHYIRLLAY